MGERKWWTHSCSERGNWRWWLHRSKGDAIVNAEVLWRARLTGVWLERSDEGKWHVALGVYWLYATLGWRTPWSKYRGYGEGKSLSLTFSDGSMRWNVWVDPDSWQSTRPMWRDGSFNPLDVALGRRDCTQVIKESRDVIVPMPEKSYPAKAELIEFTWKRPRWPFSKSMLRVSLDVPGGIPHEGKGENSWDCGTDATFGITTGECRSIPEGVGVLVGSVLRSRVKYGGWKDWTWAKEEA